MSKSNLIKSTAVVMIVSLLSRCLGLIRDLLIGNNFGASMYTDAYNVAVTIPETIFMVIGLAISTSFLPILSEELAKKGKKDMYAYANKFITMLSIVSIIIFILSLIFTREIVSFIANGFDNEALELAIKLTRITIINLLFLSFNACFTSLLQVNEDFIIPSILGLFFNAPMIAYLLVFKNYTIEGLTIANVIGNFFRVLVQVPSLIKHSYIYKISIDMKDERIRKALLLIAPVIIGAGANSLNMVVDKKVAATLSEGSISALDYAQKLIVLINTIITSSIITVTYPLMANKKNSGDNKGFIEYILKTITYSAIFLIPITVGALVLNEEIIKIVYMRGAFGIEAVSLTKMALIGYAIGIFFTALRDILNSTLFSMGKTKETTINGIIGVVINIILSVTLSKFFGVIGIAIATSSAMMVTSCMLILTLKKIIKDFKVKTTMIKLAKVFLSAIIMGVSLTVLNLNKSGDMGKLTMIIMIVAGAFIYYIMCMLLKIDEIEELNLIIRKKIGRK
ncbi:murein biosynthesis integral membrane protein MurJ [Clostridium intestinale]|uniref:Probable lipid II flippase MurJ n=1 Tax=Clostridium intestinale TaxID=36845 RepID=A0A7D6VNC4_9CLOT|nr:murein biosynthesis integral membrane protein MurJ [Clostridium intestinale]QLY78346.1 murein biosynthesis integral membrane protein MurJ [Clostridium intestinale]